MYEKYLLSDKFVGKISQSVHEIWRVQKAYTSEIKQLGKKIKKIRVSKKMTQQTLADLCELDIRTIQRIEAGEYGIGLHTLYALADSLGLKASELLSH